MSKDRRTIFRFAAVGLGIDVVWIVYQMLANPSPWSPLNNLLSVIFVILCPPVLLTFPLIDVGIGDGGSYAIWMVLALLNAALYAAIGSAYVGLRNKPEGSITR
jgi:hypothetical protein